MFAGQVQQAQASGGASCKEQADACARAALLGWSPLWPHTLRAIVIRSVSALRNNESRSSQTS